ncbi:MAG: DSBA oxidoreductase [Parcubacteria group bacterium Gr01-1014_44]|nr:MAG: DSBA oxidoreductase [Parcubacteria group bacterium Gr01-1014_44]
MEETQNNLENNNLDNKPFDDAQGKPVFSLDFGKLILPGSIVLAAVLISGSLLFASYRNNPGSQLGLVGNNLGEQKIVEVSADDDPFLGEKKAPVTIIEFSDFQCPFCRSFWKDTLPLIKSTYIDTGKVKFVYRDFPLSFHSGARPAAEAAECAEDQGKYWQMHDKIFNEQDKQGQGTVQFTKEDVVKWASQIGLDMGKFNSCLDSGKYRAEVDKDMADGTAAGVSGTPAFFINGRLVVGAQPFSAFQEAIEAELKK